jgi:hypothetical protein
MTAHQVTATMFRNGNVIGRVTLDASIPQDEHRMQ